MQKLYTVKAIFLRIPFKCKICDAPAQNESHCTFVDFKLGTSLSSEKKRQKNNFCKENLLQLTVSFLMIFENGFHHLNQHAKYYQKQYLTQNPYFVQYDSFCVGASHMNRVTTKV